ncbi:NAD(P)-binding protein [Diplocarpon rosae]|nr:NAD(P)-binding protein [Diplocarpon rosae]
MPPFAASCVHWGRRTKTSDLTLAEYKVEMRSTWAWCIFFAWAIEISRERLQARLTLPLPLILLLALPVFYILLPDLGNDIDIGSARKESATSFALEGCPQISICDKNHDGLLEAKKYMKEVSAHVKILVFFAVDTLQEEHVWGMGQKCVAEWGRDEHAASVNAAVREDSHSISDNGDEILI